MKESITLSDVDFGNPEAEHDSLAIQRSFYEAASWKTIAVGNGMPFVVGRKGSGKSAIAARLEYTVKERDTCCFLRIVPANFRHVEIRDLLACLVNKNASWQYIYRKVWDLLNAEEQIITVNLGKRFEIIFDIIGDQPPWPEIKGKHRTHRLLVECKNTDEPTDADFSKLDRDMQALDSSVAFMAYRGTSRESKGKVLEYQRAAFINSKKERIIVTLSEVFLVQCLEKKTSEKCRNNLNSLWRDHVQRWLAT